MTTPCFSQAPPPRRRHQQQQQQLSPTTPHAHHTTHPGHTVPCDTMPNHLTALPNVGFPSTPRKSPSVAAGRSLCSRPGTRRALIGTLCASPARPSHSVRQAQLFHDHDGEASPVQDEILGRPGGVPVDLVCRPGLPRRPQDDSPTKLPSDDSWSDDRLYKDAPRTARPDSTHLNKWLQNQYPSPNHAEDDVKTNMTELALPPGSRRLPSSFLGDLNNLVAPVNRNVREYDGAVANFTLSKIKTALQAHPEHAAALPAGLDAQLSYQMPVSHPSRPSLPPRQTYVSGGIFPMSTLQTPDDQAMTWDSMHLPHRFKRPDFAARHYTPGSPLHLDDATSPSKCEPKRRRRLSSNPQLTAAALSAITAIQGHGSASSRTRHDVLQSRALYSHGSDCDSSSLPSPSPFHSTTLHNDNSPATPLIPPATPHLLPVSSSPLLHPSSPHFIRSALRGAGPHSPLSPHSNAVSPWSTRPSSPSHSPLAPPPRRHPNRFSPTRHGLSPDVVLFRGDSAARAKLRERRLGRKREGSWGDESLLGGRGRGASGVPDEGMGEVGTQGVIVDSGEEADEEDEGEGEGDAEDAGGVPVGCGQGARDGIKWVFDGEVARG